MKKLVCWCSCIFLLFAMAFPTLAVEPLSVNVEGYFAGQNMLRLYCNTNLDAVPSASEITLQVGNQALPITNIETFEQAGEGATYLFLIDISGSIGTKKLDSIKMTLLSIINGLSDKDNAGVLLVGDEVEIQPLTADKTALFKQIESIESGTKTTNLYLGITKGLDLLTTDTKSNQKKCLVVLSDGEDYAVKGITREEVEKKISLVRIPVYTVAMLGENPKESYVESAKILGSFARLSPGGRDLMHDLKEETSETTAQDILTSVLNSLVLTAGLNGLVFAGNEQYMKLELNAGDAGKATDGYNIATGALTAAQVTPAPSATPAPTPAPTPDATPAAPAEPTPAPVPTILGLPALWVYIGGGVLILIAIAVILIVAGKRRKQKRNDIAGLQQQSDTMQFSDLDLPVTGSFGVGNTVPLQQPDTEAIALRFTRVGPKGGQVYRAQLGNPVVIGRKADLATLAFPEDDMLSSKHCEIIRRGTSLFIGDLGSTNKTYVNGVMTAGYHKLEQDDVIYIGSMELRINWDENGRVD